MPVNEIRKEVYIEITYNDLELLKEPFYIKDIQCNKNNFNIDFIIDSIKKEQENFHLNFKEKDYKYSLFWCFSGETFLLNLSTMEENDFTPLYILKDVLEKYGDK